jgi:beta-glucosidase
LKLFPGKDGSTVTAQFDIENSGGRDGAEATQIYIQDVESSVPRPAKELKGFQKLFLKAGEKKKISIPLDFDAFAFYDTAKRSWVAEKGEFKVLVGSSSRDIRLEGNFTLKRTLEKPD